MFCVGLNRRTIAWTGPQDLDELRALFKQKFGRTCLLTGDCLLCGSEEEVIAHYQKLALFQGHHASQDTLKSMKGTELLHLILTPGKLEIFDEYKSVEKDRRGAGGTFMADLQQHHCRGVSSGLQWPCQLTHGIVV